MEKGAKRNMRIISGTARGRSLVAPAGMNTRPTQDHVRESLFNIIRWDVQDAQVLDLFAGTGALSLEALSRGAASCLFVDSSREAVAVITRNLRATALADHCFYNPAYLGRVFKAVYGKSMKEYIRTKRMEHAMELLKSGAGVTEACTAAGFADCSHFIVLFKKKFGETPLKYKKQMQENKANL